MISPAAPDVYKNVKIWTALCIIALIVFSFMQKSSYMEIDAMGIWVLSCLAMLFLSRKEIGTITRNQHFYFIVIGLLICLLSFLSIPLGLSHTPYSIGEFSILLSGIGIIVFTYLGYRSLIFPVSIPFIAVMGYSAYEAFVRNEDWITAPMIPVLSHFTNNLLNFLGIHSVSNGNIISFISQTGSPIYLSIVSDCTGIWSLGTFTVALIIVFSSFPASITKKSLLLAAIGYFGTVVANLTRIMLIAFTGFFFGPTGLMENVHIHIGWIVFSLWMILFWYYYFTRQIGVTFFNKNGHSKAEDKNK